MENLNHGTGLPVGEPFNPDTEQIQEVDTFADPRLVDEQVAAADAAEPVVETSEPAKAEESQAASEVSPDPVAFANPAAQQAPPPPAYTPPPVPFKTDRALWKFVLFDILTLGIYGLIWHIKAGDDLNAISAKHNNTFLMNYAWLILLAPVTFGLATLVWMYFFTDRIEKELKIRGIQDMNFGTKTFWLWLILGSYIAVGPFIYLHRLCKSLNALCADYNVRGQM